VSLRYRVNSAEILRGVNSNMPAVPEVIETPASPVGRVAAAAIIGVSFSLGASLSIYCRVGFNAKWRVYSDKLIWGLFEWPVLAAGSIGQRNTLIFGKDGVWA
jgi:hypothetical protein